MLSTKRYLLILGLTMVTGIWSCKKWDDHIKVNEEALNENLMEQIGKHSNLGKFKEYLQKTGLDKELSSSKNYTVWAPTDAALATLPADVISDVAKLKAYLMNHIAGELIFTRMAADSVRISVLNGKKIFIYNKKFDDATISEADVYVKNGVLNVVDKVIAPLPNIWEYILQTKASFAQNNYISTLNYTAQDPSKAELDSINPATGLPVYKPGTGIVQINTFNTKVYNVMNEDSLYTYILLNDAGFTTELNKQKPYFVSASADTTTRNASWNVVKDMVIKGLYQPAQLPAALISKFGVHVNINKLAITETRKVSNGIVYVMNEAITPIAEKIPPVIIEGEFPDAFSNYDDRYISKVFYRQRMNTLTGKPFKDIYLSLGSIGVNYYVDYISNNLFTAKYKVYWVAYSDRVVSGQGDDPYGTDSVMKQSLRISTNEAPYTPLFNVEMKVQPRDFTEIYIGDFTNTSYGWLLSYPLTTPDGKAYIYTPATRRLRVQGPAASSTGIPNNLTLDYLKFVPVLN